MDMGPDTAPVFVQSEGDDYDSDSLIAPKRRRLRIIESDEDDIDANVISIGLAKKRANSSREGKKSACYFCKKLFTGKLRRHMERRHGNEVEVAKVLALTSTEQIRLGFADLCNRGNFQYNAAIISSGTGELIVKRRPSKVSYQSDDFLPCEHCLAMFLKWDLWRHVAQCPFKPTANGTASGKSNNRAPVTSVSRMILEGATHSETPAVSEAFQKDILDKMRWDHVTRRARNDPLIMQFGTSLHHRHGHVPQRVHYISQQLRQLSRLLFEVRFGEDEPNEQVTLDKCLSARRFDMVLQATERLCKREVRSDSGRPLYENPCIGLKMGHNLVKCAEIKKGQAMRAGDTVMEQEANAFLILHKTDWSNKISSTSLASLKQRRYNHPDVLPVTSDLIKLKQYQETQLATLTDLLKEKPNYRTWRQLCDIVYSRVVIFNKRRGGETARLLLKAFLTRPNWQELASDILLKSLMPLEQQLMKR